MQVQETYHAHVMAANDVYSANGVQMGGFICTVSGSLSITDKSGPALLTALPVTAGVYYPIPIRFRTSQGATITLTGGAAGTLLT